MRRSSLLTVALTVVALLALTGVAGAAAPTYVIFNLQPTPLVQPQRYFFQADAGPYLKDLVWSGWGRDTAVGTGRYIRDCAVGPCGPPGENIQDHPVTMSLSDPGPCPRLGPDAYVYRKARVEIDRDGDITRADVDTDPEFCSKQPSRRTARRAIARWFRHHSRVRTPVIHCRGMDDWAMSCTASWRRNGKVFSRLGDVTTELDGSLNVTVGPVFRGT